MEVDGSRNITGATAQPNVYETLQFDGNKDEKARVEEATYSSLNRKKRTRFIIILLTTIIAVIAAISVAVGIALGVVLNRKTQEINECASNPCVNNASCVDGINRYSCRCMPGYNETNCQNEINECASNPCVNNATCVDGINRYSCRCMLGYDGTNCQNEIQMDECASNQCVNNATCVDDINSYSCRCMPGYNGTNCQIEINECASNPCVNNATCVDGINRYSCRCMPGYDGTNCQIDIDECASSPCQNEAACNNNKNQYTCTCISGWTGTVCDQAQPTTEYYGTSFVTGFMKVFKDGGIPTILIACPEGTALINVSIPTMNIDNQQHQLTGGALNLTYSQTVVSSSSGVISKRGVLVTSDRPVMLFAGSFRATFASADGTFVLPEKSLGIDYIISGYHSTAGTEEFLIIGTVDSTDVSIKIKSVTENITLNRLETYFRAEADLSGSIISSSAPVYVLSGHSCALIPNDNVSYCDYIDEAMPPVKSLGNLHVVSYMNPRPDFTISIAAPYSNTSLTIYNSASSIIDMTSSMMQMDAIFRTYTDFQSLSIVSSQPVLVTQYGHGSQGTGGDPSMMIIPDVSRFGNKYDFVVPYEFNSTVAIVIYSSYGTSGLQLDGVAFAPIQNTTVKTPSKGDYFILYGKVTPGYHNLSHTGGAAVSFGGWLYGFGNNKEYAWSLGHV